MSDYQGIPLDELERWKSSYWNQYIAIKHEADKSAVAKSYFKDYKEVLDEIVRRQSESKVDTKKATAISPAESNLLKDIRLTIEKIPELAPGGDASSYLADLENAYKLYLSDSTKFEPEFVRLCKTRLCQSYLTTVTHSEAATSTFDEYKIFIRKNFGSKKNVYQCLDGLFDLQMDADVQDFAVKLENEVSRVRVEIEDQFEVLHESKSRTIDQASMFQLFGTMILLKAVKAKLGSQNYNFVVRGLEKCFDISSASAVIKTYMDQSEKVDDLGHDSNRTFHARRGDPRRNSSARAGGQKPASKEPTKEGQVTKRPPGTCFSFRDTGKCHRGKWCKFEPCKSKNKDVPKPSVNYFEGDFFASQDFQHGALE